MFPERCVSIPLNLDVILEIMKQLSASGDGRNALQAVARTCKALQHPALEALWSRLPSLIPLMNLLPTSIIQERADDIDGLECRCDADDEFVCETYSTPGTQDNGKRFSLYMNMCHGLISYSYVVRSSMDPLQVKLGSHFGLMHVG